MDKGERAHVTQCFSELLVLGSARIGCTFGFRAIRWQPFCTDVQRYTLLQSHLASLTNIRLQMTVRGALISSMATLSAVTLCLGRLLYHLGHLFTRSNLPHSLPYQSNVLPARVATILSEYGATVKTLCHG